MPRQERTKSGTGIYHVMLRGINKQDMFEDDEDYLQMTSIKTKMITESLGHLNRCNLGYIYRFLLNNNIMYLSFIYKKSDHYGQQSIYKNNQ